MVWVDVSGSPRYHVAPDHHHDHRDLPVVEGQRHLVRGVVTVSISLVDISNFTIGLSVETQPRAACQTVENDVRLEMR